MPRKFGEIAFTPQVQAAQEQRGSRQTYERYIAKGPANDSITPKLEEFIAQLDGFYLGREGNLSKFTWHDALLTLQQALQCRSCRQNPEDV